MRKVSSYWSSFFFVLNTKNRILFTDSIEVIVYKKYTVDLELLRQKSGHLNKTIRSDFPKKDKAAFLQVTDKAFQHILKYFETDKMPERLSYESMIEMLKFAYCYDVPELELGMLTFLMKYVNSSYRSLSKEYKETFLYLMEVYLHKVYIHAEQLLKPVGYEVLLDILSKPNILVSEEFLIKIVQTWIELHPMVTYAEKRFFLDYVNLEYLPKESLNDFNVKLYDQAFINAEDLEAAKTSKANKLYTCPNKTTGIRIPNVNVATKRCHTTLEVTRHASMDNRKSLLASPVFDQQIEVTGDKESVEIGIIIKFADPYVLNLIKFDLVKSRNYQVIIQNTSRGWKRVANFGKCVVNGLQTIHFEETAVKAIKIIRNGSGFTIKSIEALYATKPQPAFNLRGIIQPAPDVQLEYSIISDKIAHSRVLLRQPHNIASIYLRIKSCECLNSNKCVAMIHTTQKRYKDVCKGRVWKHIDVSNRTFHSVIIHSTNDRAEIEFSVVKPETSYPIKTLKSIS